MRVVVVGAGIAGLAAAHALRDRRAPDGSRVEVALVEAANRVGGKLLVSEVGGLLVDEGAETFLSRAPEGRQLIEAVGLADSLTTPATSAASVWTRGRLRPLPPRTMLGVPSSAASLRGVLSPAQVARAALDRWLPGRPVEELPDVAVGAWVGHRLGRAVVDQLVDPLLGGVYAGRADELSLRATMPALDRGHRSALVAAAASVPAPAPGRRAASPFGALVDGMGSLPAAVLRASGASLVSGRTVRRIESLPQTGRDASTWRVLHGPTTDERVLAADGLVLAVPATAAGRLLQDVVPAAATELAAIETASMAIVTTVWRRENAGSVSGSGYLIPAATRPRRPVKAVTFASRKWAHLDRGELVVVRCSIGRHRDTADLQRDDADLLRLAVAELTEYAGFVGAPVASRISRWGGGLPQYAVGHIDRVRRIRAAVGRRPGLAVCGAVYEGVGVPACIRTGQQAAAEVAKSLGLS